MALKDLAEVGEGAAKMAVWQKVVLVAISLTLVVSVAARGMLSSSEPEPRTQSVQQTDPNGLSTGLVPGATQPGQTPPGATTPEEEAEGVEAALPYLTEGSFFALIGFALGYASKKIVKLMLIFVAIFFVGLQLLAYQGIATVDWGRAVQAANDLILNLNENSTFLEVLKDRVPTVGGFAAGYFLGFKKG